MPKEPVCKKHPDNVLDNFLYNSEGRYKCRLCRQEVARNNYQNNKDKIRVRIKKYRQDNPEKLLKFRHNEIQKKMQISGFENFHNLEKGSTSLRLALKLRSLLVKIVELERKYEKFTGHEKSDNRTT